MFFAYNKTCHGKGCGYPSWWITIKSSLVISLSWHVFLHFADWVSRVCHFFRPGAHASGIFWNLLEIWMPTIKKHNNRRAADRRGSESLSEQQGSKCTNQSCRKTTNHSRASCFIRSRMTSRPHRLKKTSSMQSKRRDLHHTWLHRETNEKLSFLKHNIFTPWNFLLMLLI